MNPKAVMENRVDVRMSMIANAMKWCLLM